MAAQLMSLKKIDKAFVGSDRIAINGDFANKIGTYSVAVNCKYHNIPFYVVAPYTTVDPLCNNGSEIPIEQRVSTEVTGYMSTQWAPPNINVYNPSFDVTPHTLVSGWVLDRSFYTLKNIEQGVLKSC
jgi:methylthioribose-1-phosphate isomerase